MNKLILNYILINYFKIILKVTFVFYLFGLILNLFEEIEFFKNIEVGIFIPALLTAIHVPSMIIELMPFIIFISSMWLLINMRDKRELLTFKIYGYSNFKIFLIIGLFSFALGWTFLSFINPISSNMTKYYEKTKSKYAKDIDHLITFNKNGLWIKENFNTDRKRIIFAKKAKGNFLEKQHLQLNSNKIYKKLKIKNKINTINAINLTIDWYLNFSKNKKFSEEQLKDYLNEKY